MAEHAKVFAIMVGAAASPAGKHAGVASVSDEVRAAGGVAPRTGRAERGNARTGGQVAGVASVTDGVHAAVGYALLCGMR
jgi:hypothetical protein